MSKPCSRAQPWFGTIAAAVVASAMMSAKAHAESIVSFQVQRWTTGVGADGRTYALVVVDAAWSWRDARALALGLGADLASTPSAPALAFVANLASAPGAFDCAGPWIGGYRFNGAGWQWTSGEAFTSFAWAPGRPAQAQLLDAALCLGGEDSPDGTWIDALAGPDAGATTRSALLVWNSFADCDGDGLPDLLQIAVDPTLDADGNGAIDRCTHAYNPDLNGDGAVNGADLGLLLAGFNGPGPLGDLNRDGLVNGADLGMLLGAWTH